MEDLKVSEIFSAIEEISINKDERLLSFLTDGELAEVLDIILAKLEHYNYLKVNKNSQCLDRVPPVIYSGHFGNGLSIWYAGTETKVAFIDKYRNITFYEKSLDYITVMKIVKLAKTDDRCISATQEQKVFMEKPKP